MTRPAFVCVVMLVVLSGCMGRSLDFAPDEEAIYDAPIEEVWPRVQTFLTANGFTYRADPGRAALETEWRAEFAGSRVAGYWHRYLVVASPEGPARCKLVITRVTRSANQALRAAGSELVWGGDWRSARDDSATLLGGADSLDDSMNQSFGDVTIVAESAHAARDLMLEWKVFRAIAPELARNAKKSSDTPEVVVKKNDLIECGVPILGLGKVVRPGNVVLLGELHGTQQVPHFLAQSVCQAVTHGVPVTVGLEIPVGNQERLKRFVASEGREEDWAKLMESPFWRSPYPDGRNSEAIVYLLEALRKLRGQGMDVELFAFDHPELEGDAREEALAKAVLEVVGTASKRAVVVVSGNIHPRQVKGLPWNRDYQPMGLRIARQHRPVFSLDMAYASGSAWICSLGDDQKLECGVRPTKGHDQGARYFVHLFDVKNRDGFHGFFYVGPVSASPPAVRFGAEPAGDSESTASESQPQG